MCGIALHVALARGTPTSTPRALIVISILVVAEGGMFLGIFPAEEVEGERSRNACGAGVAVGSGGLRRGTDDVQCNWG